MRGGPSHASRPFAPTLFVLHAHVSRISICASIHVHGCVMLYVQYVLFGTDCEYFPFSSQEICNESGNPTGIFNIEFLKQCSVSRSISDQSHFKHCFSRASDNPDPSHNRSTTPRPRIRVRIAMMWTISTGSMVIRRRLPTPCRPTRSMLHAASLGASMVRVTLPKRQQMSSRLVES